ncbi:MAG: cupin domain-containing protein [Candidatus Omnitrophica bacterium]|nr:cupin domain-containing protein [Candidatus Omnitrophota bacterium]MBU4488560.1 cupin domain-containing protein [Candidatus Omnitrophota bacterium]MCG2705435.1 cupin domain-containing protein [Candidatus Omnitrophota bacterium]
MNTPRNEVALKKLSPDSGEKYTRLFSKKDKSAISFRSGSVVLMPGENVGEHSTESAEELLIILEGKGKLSLGEAAEVDIEKDHAVYIPPNTLHDVKNTGKESLRYVFVTA